MNDIDEDIDFMQRVIEGCRCQSCDNIVTHRKHSCPYDEDINGIHDEDNCNCCVDCENNCCMEI